MNIFFFKYCVRGEKIKLMIRKHCYQNFVFFREQTIIVTRFFRFISFTNVQQY